MNSLPAQNQFAPFGVTGLALDVEVRVLPALTVLRDAHLFSVEFEVDLWQFAVEMSSLVAVGLTKTDCRWLVQRGYVEHARETSLAGQSERTFQPCPALQFASSSCFVLTDEGARFLDDSKANARVNGEPEATIGVSRSEATPHWDRERHELTLGGTIVKRFRLPAANQEAILDAFEEDGWPHRIDDPLPPKRGQDPKRRVHDTINSLNRNQREPLLRFCGDGTGQGICWELTH